MTSKKRNPYLFLHSGNLRYLFIVMPFLAYGQQKEQQIDDMDAREISVSSSGTDGPYEKFIVPVVDPWQMRLAVTE